MTVVLINLIIVRLQVLPHKSLYNPVQCILTASQETFGQFVALILCLARRSINFLVQISVRRVTIATYLSMNDRGKFSEKKTEGKYFQTPQSGGIKSLARILTGGGGGGGGANGMSLRNGMWHGLGNDIIS